MRLPSLLVPLWAEGSGGEVTGEAGMAKDGRSAAQGQGGAPGGLGAFPREACWYSCAPCSLRINTTLYFEHEILQVFNHPHAAGLGAPQTS